MHVEIRHLGTADEPAARRARCSNTSPTTSRLASPVGFVSCVEMTHPNKGTEMFLYELGVDPPRAVTALGRSLVDALAALAPDDDILHVIASFLPQPHARLASPLHGHSHADLDLHGRAAR